MKNNTKKKIAPIVITVVVVLYTLPLVAMVAWAAGLAGAEPGGMAAVPFLLLYAFIGGAVIVGLVVVLRQRLREIDGGEEDDAKQY